MSIERPADSAGDVRSAGTRPARGSWRSDLRTARVLRFAIGVTFAAALAFGLRWPLFFLTPVFAAFFLSLPLPSPTVRQGLALIGDVLVAFALGLSFTLFLLPYPFVYVAVLGLVLFHIFYMVNRGGSIMLALMSLIAVLILPMLALWHDALAAGFSLYFVLSCALSVMTYLLAHGLFPDPTITAALPKARGLRRGYMAPAATAAAASTGAVLPLAVAFVVFGWLEEILIMIYAAIFSLSPQVAKGKAAGLKSLTSTVIGGAAAMVFYWLIVAVPEFHFFVPLMFLTALLFGSAIFSGGALAGYLPSAMIALLILIGGSMSEGADFTGKLVTRVLLISLATLYVVSVLAVLQRFVFREQGPLAQAG